MVMDKEKYDAELVRSNREALLTAEIIQLRKIVSVISEELIQPLTREIWSLHRGVNSLKNCLEEIQGRCNIVQEVDGLPQRLERSCKALNNLVKMEVARLQGKPMCVNPDAEED